MKAVIFAGGYGTRFSEQTQYIPKPMIEIGGKPILWHIMKGYAAHGITEFIICAGYRQYVIKEYFYNYFMHNSDMRVDLSTGDITWLEPHSEKWKVTIVDTGLDTLTAGRLRRVRKYIGKETFLLTYGDGVSDIDIIATINKHRESGAILSMTVYEPTGRFGSVEIDKETSKVLSFKEKPDGVGNWINAGFFVCEPEVFDFLPDNADTVMFEREPLELITEAGKLAAYKHLGFWKPMDTLRDNQELNRLWETDSAPWKIWH